MGFLKKFKKEEDNRKQFIYVIEDLVDIKSGTVTVGYAQDEVIRKKDHVYIYGEEGLKLETSISALDPEMKNVTSSEKNSYVSLVLQNVAIQDLAVGDIVTNQKFLEDGVNNYLLKSYLYFLSADNVERKSEDSNIKLQQMAIQNFVFKKELLLKGQVVLKDDRVFDGVLREGDLIQYDMITTTEGDHYLPVFTHSSEVNVENPTTFVASFKDVYSILSEHEDVLGVVLNPYSNNVVLSNEYINKLSQDVETHKSNVTKVTIDKDTPVRIGHHENYPQALADALIAQAKLDEGVDALWLLLMEREGEFSHLLIIEAESFRDVVSNYGAIAEDQSLLNGYYLDIMSKETSFGKDVRDEYLIYKK